MKPTAARLLVVEDRDSLREMLQRALTREGYLVTGAVDVASAGRALGGPPFDLVLTDLRLPDGSGIEVVRAARVAGGHAPPVVVLTGYGTVESAVAAMKEGAADFLEKPVELPQLLALVADLLARRAADATRPPGSAEGARQRPDDERAPAVMGADAAWRIPGGPTLVGGSAAFRDACHLLERVAAKSTTVLLLGESGTGKELFARALHCLSPRRAGPFVAVNCAAIPEALLENELFGHEKGAFTGADRRQAGRFEQAHGGTLFLDEIGELAPEVQGKVLRVLEERAFERVGGGATVRVDVRLVAATNRPLEAMVASGRFRSDLFFRLNVFPIAIPPLRERPEDLAPLTTHLLAELAAHHRVAAPRLQPAAATLLAAQSWPGNVRELANVLERLVILHEGAVVGTGELGPLLGAAPASPKVAGSSTNAADRSELEALRAALVATEGDKTRAAELLGVSYRTLQRRVLAYDLEGFPKYR